MMTPRERLRAALRFEPYDGPVPYLELEFQLAEELFGERNLRHGDYEALPAYRRRDELARNARLWIRIAERFDHSVINGTHWLPLEAQAESFQIIRELSGDRFMLSAFQDGTQAIPSGADLASLSFRIADDPEGLLHDLETRRILQSGVLEGGLFILREGNNLAPGTPLENIEAMYPTGREWGRLQAAS